MSTRMVDLAHAILQASGVDVDEGPSSPSAPR